MTKWVNLTTVRGDIIGKVVDHLGNPLDVETVADMKQILVDHNFIFVWKPISPKASPRLIKVYEDGTEEHFTEEEEEQAALGLPPIDNGKQYMIKRDANSMRISYTSINSVFKTTQIVISTSQIVSASILEDEKQFEEIANQVHAIELSGTNS